MTLERGATIRARYSLGPSALRGLGLPHPMTVDRPPTHRYRERVLN